MLSEAHTQSAMSKELPQPSSFDRASRRASASHQYSGLHAGQYVPYGDLQAASKLIWRGQQDWRSPAVLIEYDPRGGLWGNPLEVSGDEFPLAEKEGSKVHRHILTPWPDSWWTHESDLGWDILLRVDGGAAEKSMWFFIYTGRPCPRGLRGIQGTLPSRIFHRPQARIRGKSRFVHNLKWALLEAPTNLPTRH